MGKSEEPGKRLIAHGVNLCWIVLNRVSDLNRTNVGLTLSMERPPNPSQRLFYYVWDKRKNRKFLTYIPVAMCPDSPFDARKSFLAIRALTGYSFPKLVCNVVNKRGRLELDRSKPISYNRFSDLFLRLLKEIGVPASALETRPVPGKSVRRRLMNTQSLRAGGATHLRMIHVPKEIVTARGGWSSDDAMLVYSRNELEAHMVASKALM